MSFQQNFRKILDVMIIFLPPHSMYSHIIEVAGQLHPFLNEANYWDQFQFDFRPMCCSALPLCPAGILQVSILSPMLLNISIYCWERSYRDLS